MLFTSSDMPFSIRQGTRSGATKAVTAKLMPGILLQGSLADPGQANLRSDAEVFNHMRVIVICNYSGDPITAVSCRKPRLPIHSMSILCRPHQQPPRRFRYFPVDFPTRYPLTGAGEKVRLLYGTESYCRHVAHGGCWWRRRVLPPSPCELADNVINFIFETKREVLDFQVESSVWLIKPLHVRRAIDYTRTCEALDQPIAPLLSL